MQLVAELDSDGTRYEYVYGGGMPLELVVTTSGTGGTTERYAYQVDAGGSVIGITDEDGDEVAKYAYDPYGVPTGVLGSDPLVERNPLRYRGYYFDTETGNYYMPARYYAPESARFLSVDPAPPKAGDPVSINRYAYCEADPVQYDDPKGEGLIEAFRADELDGGEAARSEAAHIQAANHLPAGKAKTHHEATAANLRVVITMAASLCMPCHPVAPPPGLDWYLPTKPDEFDLTCDAIGSVTEYCQWIVLGSVAVECGAAPFTNGFSLAAVPGSAGCYLALDIVEATTDYVALVRTTTMLVNGKKTPMDGLIAYVDLGLVAFPFENNIQLLVIDPLMLEYAQ